MKMKPTRKLRKPADSSSKLLLEEVIGLTTKNANGLASNVSSSNCIYVAGCVIVVYNVESGTQSHLMVSNRTPKPLSCVAMSKDGGFVAAGESGHYPAVLIWDCASLRFLSELKSHQHGVACTDFSPDGKHLVSVGFPHDEYICLWDWRSATLVAKLKACPSYSSVESVSFSSDAKFIITAGKKHLKVWKLGSAAGSHANTRTKSLAMQGKPVNLGYQKGCSFIAVTSPILPSSLVNFDVANDVLPIYALTDAGVLFLLHSGVSIKRSVDLKVKKSFALSVSNKLIACACNNGVVKLFATTSLEYSGILHYAEVNRCKKAGDTECNETINKNDNKLPPTPPHAIACQFSNSEKLVVVYGDHSLYIWNIQDVKKATRCYVLVSHSACIWDIKNLPCEHMHDPSLACAARGCSGGVSFATCSADGTIRVWDLVLQSVSSWGDLSIGATQNYSMTDPVKAACSVSAGIFERDSVELGISNPGFRSMAISSDGKYLAAGDCQGNLHIYNLQTSDYICFQDTHDAEILSLSFSLPSMKNLFSEERVQGHYFLASGGRDRIIHLHDVERKFNIIGSVDDHSAAVTSVKLSGDGCKILSCTADSSLAFHDVGVTGTDCKISRCAHQMASYTTVYDMAVDPNMKVAVTVGKDKKINIFSITTGELIRSFKHDANFGDPVKVTVDPSCSFLVCSYSNRSIYMYDFFTGEIVARAVGHADVVTGICVLSDCKHIVSVAADSCILVWKVPPPLSSKMLQKIKENCRPLSPSIVQPTAICQIKFCEENDHLCKSSHEEMKLLESSNLVSPKLFCRGSGHQETSAFKFSISRLPKWAQVKVTRPMVIAVDHDCTSSQQGELKALSPTVDRHDSLDVQTPPKGDQEGSEPFLASMSRYSSDTDTSHRACLPHETHRHWLTIHTVCLDFLNSPGVWDMETKDQIVPLNLPILSKDHAGKMISDAAEISSKDCSLIDHGRLHDPGYASLESDQNSIEKTSACQGLAVPKVSDQFKSETIETGIQAMMDVNASCMRSQDKDLCRRKFGNLSANVKTGERKSSSRRSYSARFVLRRDLLGGQKKLFDTPTQDVGCESTKQGQEATSYVFDPPTGAYEASQRIETHRQACTMDLVLSQSQSANFSNVVKLGNLELENIRDHQESTRIGFERQNTIITCKEALQDLESAAEKAFQLFTKLGTLASGEEVPEGPEALLYGEAAEMLPSIAKKVHAVAQLVQSTNSTAGRSTADISRFEPLLGTFAESLSQRVVEILQKNCGSSSHV